LTHDRDSVASQLWTASDTLREIEAETKKLQTPTFQHSVKELSSTGVRFARVQADADVLPVPERVNGSLGLVKAGQQVPVLAVDGEWSIVFMAGNRLGWIATNTVRLKDVPTGAGMDASKSL